MSEPGPRIAPVPLADRSAAQQALLAPIGLPEPQPNLFATLVHHVGAAKAILQLGQAVVIRTTLGDRRRELVTLRVAYRCRSAYEWGQHVRIAREAGVSDDEILRVAGPVAAWEGLDRALLQAADELIDRHEVHEETWSALAADLDEATLLEVQILVGYYVMLAGLLRSTRIQVDPGLAAFGEV